jgi:hypothetical protein
MGDEVEKELLESVGLERRAALKRLLHGAAYVVPLVASFALSGISPLDVAHATGNQPPEAVPTLGEWAVPVLGVALASAAVTRLKKV